MFIRIVGTYNTANEVFHCVHFEIPAQIPLEPFNAIQASDSNEDIPELAAIANISIDDKTSEDKD